MGGEHLLLATDLQWSQQRQVSTGRCAAANRGIAGRRACRVDPGVVLFHAIMFHAILCPAMLCHAIPPHPISSHLIPSHPTPLSPPSLPNPNPPKPTHLSHPNPPCTLIHPGRDSCMQPLQPTFPPRGCATGCSDHWPLHRPSCGELRNQV